MPAPRHLPVHEFIKQQLRRKIERGELAVGEALPSEHELARQFEVSRSLARQAMRDLEIEGYIERSQGSRSRVADRAMPGDGAAAAFERARILGLSFIGVRSAFTNAIVDAFAIEAYRHGFHALTHNLWLDAGEQCDFLRMLRRSGISGLAVGLWQDVESAALREVMDEFADAGFPVVQIDREIPGWDRGDTVASDNVAIGERLVGALLAEGRRTVCVVADAVHVTAVRDRLEGWRRALRARGVQVDESLVVVLEESGDNGPLRSALARRPRPDAFFCINEYLFSRLHDYLKHKGHDPEREFGFAVVDDSSLVERMGLGATVAVQDARGIGTESARCLVSRIAEPGLPPRRCRIAPNLTGKAVV